MNKFILLCMCVFATSAAELPIAASYGGRCLPLDVSARHWLYEYSHSHHLPAAVQQQVGASALSFLWQLHFFGSAAWQNTPFFWVESAALKSWLALPKETLRFSFQQLKLAIRAAAPSRESSQELLTELEAILPRLAAFEQLQGAPLNQQAFEEAFLKSKHLPEVALQLEMQHPLAMRLKQAGHIVKILPGKFKNGEWFSPHAFHVKVYNAKTHTLDLVENFTLYSDDLFQLIRQTYFDWEKAVLKRDISAAKHFEQLFKSALLKSYDALATKPHIQASGKRLEYPTRGQLLAEQIYFYTPLAAICLALYLAAFACLLLGIWQAKKSRIGRVLALIGFASHTALLALRSYILGRPPVTNMLETLLYVPWVSVAVGLLFQRSVPLMAATFSAALLLAILNISYLGEHFENLQAVLDSQYWLIIHVLMVVGSYGLFILSAALGHVYLSVAVLKKASPTFYSAESSLQKDIAWAILQTLYLGTALLIGGTLLGGMWAAQSWGRFWDWDPKEAWAFISICVYVLWIHAYRFHKMGNFGLAVGSILGVLIISFTWYGVNYILGTGLHSYGFGKGGQWIYYSYLYAELLFVATMTTVAWRRGFWKNKLAKNSNSMI